jgi:TRAP transporter 4TM/12TM fusion protein
LNSENNVTTPSTDQLLEQFDKETSSQRTLVGPIATVIFLIAVSMSIFHLYTAGFGILLALKQRTVHLTFALVLVFLLYPARKKLPKTTFPLYEYIFIAISIAIGAYLWINFEAIIYRAGNPNQMDMIMGVLAILIVLEATRRAIGPELPFIASLFVVYAYFGPYIPGLLNHRGFPVSRIIYQLYMTTEGIFGTPLGVSSTFVFLFILFGSFLDKTGVGNFFISLAYSLTGGTRGGPAKTAVLASGLMGSISGSSVANVVTTGSFTIPLMKSIGYKSHFAGAVEAAASTGGQIMPPVMGAAAFIMSEFTGIPYSRIIISAAIPAILYYLSVGIMVDLEAVKLGLKGMARSELPDAKKTIREGSYMIIPILGILLFLFNGFTPLFSAFYGILLAIMISLPPLYMPFIGTYFFFKVGTDIGLAIAYGIGLAAVVFFLKRLNPACPSLSRSEFIDALNKGARGAIGVACACACAGIIVGVVTMSGLGLKLANIIVALAGGRLFFTLFFTMIASLILGMGLPTTAKYIVLATMAVPALLRLDVPLIAAHMFILYFGVVADVTPPVALAAYAGAGVAGANAMKTGWTALKLSLAAFLIPYIFCYSPDLLLIDTTVLKASLAFVSACIGILALACSVQAYMLTKTNLIERAFLFAAAIALINPGITTDLFGVGVLVSVYLWQRYRVRRCDLPVTPATP